MLCHFFCVVLRLLCSTDEADTAPIASNSGAHVKIAKPLLLVSTPLGVAGGLYEAAQLAGGLVFIMFALVAVISAAMGMLVMTIRRERREALARESQPAAATGSSTP